MIKWSKSDSTIQHISSEFFVLSSYFLARSHSVCMSLSAYSLVCVCCIFEVRRKLRHKSILLLIIHNAILQLKLVMTFRIHTDALTRTATFFFVSLYAFLLLFSNTSIKMLEKRLLLFYENGVVLHRKKNNELIFTNRQWIKTESES